MINQQGVQTVVMLNQMKENNEVNIVNILFSSKKSNFLTNPSKKELAMAFFLYNFVMLLNIGSNCTPQLVVIWLKTFEAIFKAFS